MWFLCRSGDARCCLAKRAASWGEISHALSRQKECQIIEGHLLPDQVHMCIAIPRFWCEIAHDSLSMRSAARLADLVAASIPQFKLSAYAPAK